MAVLLGLVAAIVGGIGEIVLGIMYHVTWELCLGVGLLAFVAGAAFDYFVMFQTPKAERLRDAGRKWTPPAPALLEGNINEEAMTARLRGGQPPAP